MGRLLQRYHVALEAFGGFHKKKKEPSQDQQQQPAQSGQAGAAANQNFTVLMESTTQMTKYSSASVDSARFGIPAGYAKVQADIQKKQP